MPNIARCKIIHQWFYIVITHVRNQLIPFSFEMKQDACTSFTLSICTTHTIDTALIENGCACAISLTALDVYDYPENILSNLEIVPLKNCKLFFVFFLLRLLLTYASSSRKSMIATLYNSNNVIRMKWWNKWIHMVVMVMVYCSYNIIKIFCHFTAPLSFYESLT